MDSFLFYNILIYNSACTIAEQQHLTVELGTEDDVLLIWPKVFQVNKACAETLL